MAPSLLSLAILVGAVAVHVSDPALLVTLRNDAFDFYQKWKPRPYQPAPVRIIDIDDESLNRIGQWPWPRTRLADLVDRLNRVGAIAIVFDIVFSEPDRTSPGQALAPWVDRPAVRALAESLPDHDRVFAEAIAKARVATGFIMTNVVRDRQPEQKAGYATSGDDPLLFVYGFRGAELSLPEIEAASLGSGALNYIPDDDAVVRRVPLLLGLGGKVYPTLTAEALRIATGAPSYLVRSSGAEGEDGFGARSGIESVLIGGVSVVTDSKGQVLIHYSRSFPERYVPAWKILDGSADPDLLAGHIVLIGTSASGLKDVRSSPLNRAIPGVEIHAQALEQIIQGTYLTRPWWAVAVERLFLVALSLILIVLIPRFGAAWSAVIGGAAITGVLGGSAWAFDKHQLLLDPFIPSVTALTIYLVCSALRHLQTERQQRWIRNAFSSYVSPNLVQHLIDHTEELTLGGERRVCTFLFTDLEGFTALVERTDPEDIVALLNEYLDQMMRIAFSHGGTLDKIVGDAVVLMFSAPVVQMDHAARAVACAMEMDAFCQSFAASKRAQGVSLGRTRIGVNTGSVIVGNFGGSSVFDYTAHGTAINVAARLEGANKYLGTRVCISQATIDGCHDFVGRPVATLVVKGTTRGIRVFEPLTETEAESPHIKAYMEAFDLMERNDIGAREIFASLAEAEPADPLAALHNSRLERGESGATIVLAEK